MMPIKKKPKKQPLKRALRFEVELKLNDSNEYTTVDYPKLIQNMINDMKVANDQKKSNNTLVSHSVGQVFVDLF